MKPEQVQQIWQASVTDDLLGTIYRFADAVEKAAQVEVLRQARETILYKLDVEDDWYEAVVTLTRMADELEKSK